MSQTDVLELEKKLLEKQDKLEDLKEKVEKEKEDYTEKLQKLSGLTKEEAKKLLLDEVEKQEAAS
ncbi:MAG: Rnase Y domain-containing protein, partial [Candidatus Levyibacteriota bacterium]